VGDLAVSDTDDHEVLRAFAREGFRLNEILYEMLNEHHKHRTERRGCGFTQATRHLAEFVNQRRHRYECDEVRLFASRELHGLKALLDGANAEGIRLSWRNIGKGPAPSFVREHPRLAELYELERARQSKLRLLRNAVELEESRLLTAIVCDLFLPEEPPPFLEVPAWPDKLQIGTCPLAEKYFLELADEFVRRGGQMNVLVDDDERPLLLEKLALGDEHSCISVAPLVLNGVTLPPGSLLGARYEGAVGLRANRNIPGHVIPVSRVSGFRFLRLTTLSVSPSNRRRAFTRHFDAQLEGGLFAPGSVTIEQLSRVAERQL
jgi:hypothetical protein